MKVDSKNPFLFLHHCEGLNWFPLDFYNGKNQLGVIMALTNIFLLHISHTNSIFERYLSLSLSHSPSLSLSHTLSTSLSRSYVRHLSWNGQLTVCLIVCSTFWKFFADNEGIQFPVQHTLRRVNVRVGSGLHRTVYSRRLSIKLAKTPWNAFTARCHTGRDRVGRVSNPAYSHRLI